MKMKVDEKEQIKPNKISEPINNTTNIPIQEKENIFNILNIKLQNNSQNKSLYKYKEIYLEDTLNKNDKKLFLYFKNMEVFNNFRYCKCCKCCLKGIIGFIILNILFCIFSLGLCITLLIIINKFNDKYCKESLLNSKFPSFWCNFRTFESKVLFSNCIIIISLFLFEIISLLIHKKIIKLEMKKKIIVNIFIFINILFLLIFLIYIILFSYIFLNLTFIGNARLIENIKFNSNNTYNSNYKEYIIFQVNNNLLLFLLLYISLTPNTTIYVIIYFYLNLKFDEKSDDNSIKTISTNIGNISTNIQIKINNILCLEDITTKEHYKFKSIKITNMTNEFIYIKLENKQIINMLSITDWKYPILNKIYVKLMEISKIIFAIILILFILFNNKIINFNEYSLVKKIYKNYLKYQLIFLSYGDIEKIYINFFFIAFAISLIFILFFILKIIFFGGFSKYIYILISFILLIFFIIVIVITIFLSLILLIFAIYSIISIIEIDVNIFKNTELIICYVVLFLNVILDNILIILYLVLAIICTQLSINVNEIRKDCYNLNNNIISKNETHIDLFEFKGLDSKNNILKEIQIEGQPRYLYYSLYKE